MSTIQIASAGVEPVTMEAARLVCRVDGDGEDMLLAGYIAQARSEAETLMRRPIMTATFEKSTDYFSDVLVLDHPRATVEWVRYIDVDGNLRALDPQDYKVDGRSDVEGTYIVPAAGRRWPEARDEVSAVTVRYRAGFGMLPSEIPQEIATWVLVRVRSIYNDKLQAIGANCALQPFVVVG